MIDVDEIEVCVECDTQHDVSCGRIIDDGFICETCEEKKTSDKLKLRLAVNALEAIKQHQEIACKSVCDLGLSYTWLIADKTLNRIGGK